MSNTRSRTPSPLAGKGKPAPKRQSTLRPNAKPSAVVSDHGTETETEDEIETASPDDHDEGEETDEIFDDSTESESESEESIEDWTESEASDTTPARKGKGKAPAKPVVAPSKPLVMAQAKRAQGQTQPARKSTTRKASKAVADLEQELDELSLGDNDIDPEDSTVIIPNKKAREEAMDHGVEYVPGKGEVDPGKKKKRSVHEP